MLRWFQLSHYLVLGVQCCTGDSGCRLSYKHTKSIYCAKVMYNYMLAVNFNIVFLQLYQEIAQRFLEWRS
jgi:hypothetical protein